jgi:D-alanyl-D-alanine dipeptidase
VDEIVLMGDARVAAVPVDPVDEPMVELRGDFATSDLKDDVDNPRFSQVRAGLADRLLAARAHLPEGFSLQVVEGLRPAALQERYFTSYRDGLRSSDPRLSDEESFLLASRHVSPPAVAPHVSGAAIDLTLVDGDGSPCDLGSAINATPEDSRGACYFDAPDLGRAARHHRAILAEALSGVGLVNYPPEWWHWSYGDRYWALLTGRPAARYGPAVG